MTKEFKCPNCEDMGWVCEAHENKPWGNERCCSAPGMPCDNCNEPDKILQKEFNKNGPREYVVICTDEIKYVRHQFLIVAKKEARRLQKKTGKNFVVAKVKYEIIAFEEETNDDARR